MRQRTTVFPQRVRVAVWMILNDRDLYQECLNFRFGFLEDWGLEHFEDQLRAVALILAELSDHCIEDSGGAPSQDPSF